MELEGVYVAQIISQLKMRSLIPVIRELRLAMDRRSFFGMLDKYFPVDWKVARNIVEYIINVSENDGDMDFSPTGYFVMDDDGNWKDLPHQDSCPRVKINAQRIRWLKEWADEKSLLSIVKKEDAKKINAAYNKAVEIGLMEKKDKMYNWKKSKTLLAYFIGRLCCKDKLKKEDGEVHWDSGGVHFPTNIISSIFLCNGKPATNIDGLRQNKFCGNKNTPPKGYEKVEKCL